MNSLILACVALALADPEPEATPEAQGGQGYYPGQQGGQGYNPGQQGGQGYNPGQQGGQGYNPGQQGGQGYNPGQQGGEGYNPGGQDGQGGQGYNPGGQGGQGYNPGANYLPLEQGGQGGQGYNPGGSAYLPLEPIQQGYNPGGSAFQALEPSVHPGGPNIMPLDPMQQGQNPGAYSPQAQPLGGLGAQPPSQCGMVDQCCEQHQQGCCVEGQQCYTYYTQECETVDAPVCNKRLRNLCHDATVPDCQVKRETKTLYLQQKVCRAVPKTEVFEYNVTVCDRSKRVPKYRTVEWENEELKEVNSTFKTELKNISSCVFTFINKTRVESVPKRVSVPGSEVTRVKCQRVPVTTYGMERRMVTVVQYVPECQMVNQQVCSQSSCQPSGCTDGGSPCSSTEVLPQPVCAQGQGQGQGRPRPGPGSACQQVNQPVCYGQGQPCFPGQGQQCCSEAPQQVCRQVPRRVPMWRNVTVPNVTWKEECRNTTEKLPDSWKTDYEERNVTKSIKICNKVYNETSFNYTIPNYEVVKTNRSEQVAFAVVECDLRVTTKKYYHTFPSADYKCENKTVPRQYILNRVLCNRQRAVKFCRGVPESDCRNVTNQQCKMVPKEICQPGCSQSKQCSQCDTFSRQGGFSTCPTATCPNYYPNTFIGGGQGGQGYNPGEGGQGGQGYYPGEGGQGGQDYYPGQGDGGQGYYPGQGGQGYNPGQGGQGGQGYYPGQGGQGGQGYYPGPGGQGGQGYYPGQGGQGYNPGQGGQGYYPGVESALSDDPEQLVEEDEEMDE